MKLVDFLNEKIKFNKKYNEYYIRKTFDFDRINNNNIKFKIIENNINNLI